MFKQGNEPGCSNKAKISLIGIRRQKNGRYAAVITDRIRHKKVWLGTFDTIEEASQAYFSKKSEFENEVLTPIVGVYKKKKRGKYNYEITSPISKKRIWLGTFSNVEEANSRVNESKKLEFKAMQQQCTNKHTQNDESAGGSEIDVPISNSCNGETDGRIESHEIDNAEECNNTTGCNPKDKISLIGVSRRKSGRYSAVITDPIKHKRVYLGTFDTIEEASQAYFNKKSEFEKLRQGNQEDKPKKNCDQIQQPESPSVVESLNTATSCDPKSRRSSIGIRRKKSGRYAAVTTDPIRHKEVCLGTFDTIDEASQAYLSKKPEFEKLSQQGNKENKPKKNCDQIQQPESPSVVTSLDTAASASGRDKIIDSHKITTRTIGVSKSKTTGRYTSQITNPITKKKIWLGTFDTAEEASHVYQSKKNEFQKLVKAKQQQCTNKQTHSKQDAWDEKLVNVKQGHENVNCESFQPESSGGSPEVDVPLSNSSNGGTVQSIDSDKIGSTTEEDFRAYQSKKFDSQSSKEVELQRNMSTDSSAGEKQEGQVDDEDLWMGEWTQLPGDRAVKFSRKLGLPIIDNYGYLLGEFSSLDDLSICVTEDDNQT